MNEVIRLIISWNFSKSMLQKTLLLVGVLFLNISAFSQDWIKVGSEPDGTEYYLKNNTVNKTGNKKVFSKTVAKDLEYSNNGKIYKVDGSSIILYEYDCNNRRMKMLSISYYDSKEKLVYTTTIPSKYIEWKNVSSGTVNEMLFENSCKLF